MKQASFKKSLVLVITIMILATTCLRAQEKNTDKEAQAPSVTEIIATIDSTSPDPVWQQALKLAKQAESVDQKSALEDQLEKAAPAQKVAIGFALLANGWQREGTEALENVISDKKAPTSKRIDAAAVLGNFGGEFAKSRLRTLMSEKNIPQILKVELAKSLWKLSYDASASQTLQDIAQNSKSYEASLEATLALGRFGRYNLVRDQLREIAKLPGEDGDEARALLKLDNKNTKNISRDEFAQQLIGEIVDKIRTAYAFDDTDPNEAEQIKAKNLASAAARALVRSLDDFNDYLDEEDYQAMIDGMRGDYGGIGAYVGMRNGLFTVLTPMWGKPAYKAGLKAMDIIMKVDGDDITKLDQNNIIKKLKGKPKTKVTLTIVRKGFDEPKDVVVERDLITLPMIYTQKLPGNIGYIRLTGFQEDPVRGVSTSSELQDALEKFKKGDGIKGLILDLRNNPGGLLSEAVSVCEKFLERNKLVVYSKGKIYPRRNYTSRILGKPEYTGPLVVLINGGSASASEIVSGALRDHNRATLVGEKSFGKGSVQMLLPVDTTNRNTRLKMTIAKYYLPSGECIHKKGIKPHVEAEEQKLEDNARNLRIKQIENRDITLWLEENFDKNKDKFLELAIFDNNNPEAYPGFDAMYKSLVEKYPDIKLDKQLVRQELRSTLYAFLRESRGIMNYPADVEDSQALQRGLVVLGEKIGGLPDIALYNSFKDKWKDDNKTTLAANTEEGKKLNTPDSAATKK